MSQVLKHFVGVDLVERVVLERPGSHVEIPHHVGSVPRFNVERRDRGLDMDEGSGDAEELATPGADEEHIPFHQCAPSSAARVSTCLASFSDQ